MLAARTIQLSLHWSNMSAESRIRCPIAFFFSLALLLGGAALLFKNRTAAWVCSAAVLGLIASLAYAVLNFDNVL